MVETPRPATTGIDAGYDRLRDLKAFDETKTGVKGLVDAGITKIPRIFIHPPEDRISADLPAPGDEVRHHFPVVDLSGLEEEDGVRRREIVEEISEAAASWGFFQVVNHGIPAEEMAEMIAGVRRFFKQDDEVKKEYYARDASRKVFYNSNFDLYTRPEAIWRDSIYCMMTPDPPTPEEYPEVCREIMMDYFKKSRELGCSLLKVLSQGLGLNPNRLLDLNCAEGYHCTCNYYPPCPEPELTMGTKKHTDNSFLTVLLQDNLGGLQVLHQGDWVDCPPIPGALVVNIGSYLQMMSNDRYKSVEHRVLATRREASKARISVACFLTSGAWLGSKMYEPLDELISDDNPPKYRVFTVKDYADYLSKEGRCGVTVLHHFKL